MQSEENPVKIGVGIGDGSSSEHALRWTLQNQTLPSNSIYLIHVYPPLRLIPTPLGNKVPISEVNEAIVKKFQEERFMETEKLVDRYRRICQKKEVKPEVCYVVGDSIQQELVDQVFKLGLTNLVLGTSTNTAFSRAFKGETIPKFVAKHAPEFCTVLVVCKGKLCSVKSAKESLIPVPSSDTASSEDGSLKDFEISTNLRYIPSFPNPRIDAAEQKPPIPSLLRSQSTQVRSRPTNESVLSENYGMSYSASATPILHGQSWMSMDMADTGFVYGGISRETADSSPQSMSVSTSAGSDTPTSVHRDLFAHDYSNFEEDAERADMPPDPSAISLQNPLEDAKLSILRDQLETEQAAKSFIRTEQMVENAKKMIVEKEKERDDAFREAEMARHLWTEQERKLEEALGQLRASLREQEKLQRDLEDEIAKHRETNQKMEEYKLMLDSAESCEKLQNKYTVYSFEDLEKATDNFSERNKLGEGGYGPVYKGELQHTTVAIKVLARDGARGRQEFEREVELLSTLHHPHMVMLLGVCPEKACIVYEYMPNGSLQDRLQCKGGSPPLPWYIRFRICAEVAIALLFLHSRPEPIVHRDLKPGNILLDCNNVSKISDVGIAKLVPDDLTFSVTMYKETVLMGTFAYMDPDYHRTGVISRESDVYALGIIMLQLLTGKPAIGVADLVDDAIAKNDLPAVLDKTAGNWPIEDAAKLASLALDCTQIRRRNRPKLESEILPVLENLRDAAAESALLGSRTIVPGFLICPISQEIMKNPHIAADGYTYDYESISVWLSNHDTSPITNLKFEHKNLIPNRTVASAIDDINDWLNKSTIK